MPKPPLPRARPIRYCSRRMVRGGSSSRLFTGRLKGAPHFGQIGLPESSSMQLTQIVSSFMTGSLAVPYAARVAWASAAEVGAWAPGAWAPEAWPAAWPGAWPGAWTAAGAWAGAEVWAPEAWAPASAEVWAPEAWAQSSAAAAPWAAAGAEPWAAAWPMASARAET